MSTMNQALMRNTQTAPGVPAPVTASRWPVDPQLALAVRDARAGDCRDLAAIYNDAIRAGYKTMDTDCLGDSYFQRLLAESSPREALLVGDTGNGVVAWAKAKQYSERGGYRYTCETSIYVADAYQNQGFGALLLRAIIGRAYALQYRHIVAKILAANEPSVRFHQRFGFTVVGRQNAIGFLNGAWQDVVIMQCVLNNVSYPHAVE